MHVTITGTESVLARVRQLQDGLYLDKKLTQLLDRLGNVGVNVASYYYNRAIYDGTNDVTVMYEVDKRRLQVIASGKSVAFIEFGTGVYNPAYEAPEMANRIGVVPRGHYGFGFGRYRAWVYRGDPGTEGYVLPISGKVLTHGNPPASAMYTASKEMRKKIREIAREVFSE